MTADPCSRRQREGAGAPAAAGPGSAPGGQAGGAPGREAGEDPGTVPGGEPGVAPGGLPGAGGLILEQSFDGDSLYSLRAALAAHAAQAGLPEDRGDDLVVAVHELAANVVRHGAGRGRLRLWQDDRALRCEISDDGPARGDGAGPGGDAGAAVPWPVEHGHGLWLVRQVADELSLRSSPQGSLATVSFSFRVPG